LQTLLSGYPITQYREGIEHIDGVARAVASERLELDKMHHSAHENCFIANLVKTDVTVAKP
jgi:organic hydroperoxide reductase OsmC/OhrA